MIITIDGPAGSGKSTLAKLISNEMNILYLDTGAIYRTITYKILKNNINPSDEKTIEKILNNTKISIIDGQIELDGIIVNNELRTSQISEMTSIFSKNILIRNFVNLVQKKIAEDNNVVIEGRDIGTVVFPDAEYKFYITADIEERSRRRFNDIKEAENTSYEEILENIKKRDYNDSSRDIAPLKKADGAVCIDTSNLTPYDTAKIMINIIRG